MVHHAGFPNAAEGLGNIGLDIQRLGFAAAVRKT